MGDLTKRADGFVERMLRKTRRLERTHPAEVRAVEAAMQPPPPSVDSRLRERRRKLRLYSAEGR